MEGAFWFGVNKADSAGLNIRYTMKTETPAQYAEFTSKNKSTKCRASKTRCFLYEEKF
jgi:hypothetical protein